jgi:3D-(3,5/4)-trihydroxycyclohexane-1,2-dione acylhydrolase (decyclizing)
MPGELHKLWRVRHPKQYHVEYGYSTMGYEIAGGLGVKLAAPDRDVFVLVGDGSYLMLSGEIATSVQEGHKLLIVVVDDHGFASIGALSRSLGLDGFGTRYGARRDGSLGVDADTRLEPLALDLAANARSLGANAVRVSGMAELRSALADARAADRTSVVVVEADRYAAVPSYDAWWEVAVPEVSEEGSVRRARVAYEEARAKQRWNV